MKYINIFNNFIKENLSDEQVLINLNNMGFSDKDTERFMFYIRIIVSIYVINSYTLLKYFIIF